MDISTTSTTNSKAEVSLETAVKTTGLIFKNFFWDLVIISLTIICSLIEKDHYPGAKVIDSFSGFFHCCCRCEIQLKGWDSLSFKKKSWEGEMLLEFFWLIHTTSSVRLESTLNQRLLSKRGKL